MKQPLSDELRVRHILDAIAEIESYLQNVSLQEFLSKSEKRSLPLNNSKSLVRHAIEFRLSLKKSIQKSSGTISLGSEIFQFMSISVSIFRLCGKLHKMTYRF
jgi:hypothetical protein